MPLKEMAEVETYEVLEKIGQGSFGVIRKVRRKADGEVLCRKEISYLRMSQKEREQLHAEFSILSSLRHPNIVAYFHREHLKATHDLHLYMEYCGNGDLGRVIRQLKTNNQYAEEEFVWSVFAQLLTALYRCHYGTDPPEVGKNVMLVGKDTRPRPFEAKGGVMILHRDLKPENVFLSTENTVKLGDFGLSKLLQSHDFASTYVGTPFYMSPEICAAERYTLHSDIWSLGCIMYELCAREPPFNARTHLQLVQKIKEGRYTPLPSIYSDELHAAIKSCLQVNPRSRPDTATLLNLPAVKLMRKEREVVELGKVLKAREELADRRLLEIANKEKELSMERESIRYGMEATLKREWEVKARLEIDRQVQMEVERLSRRFEEEVSNRVREEVEKQMQALQQAQVTSDTSPADEPISSVSTQDETDFPSTTDLSELSLESAGASAVKPEKKGTRTPFQRSKTLFIGSPMDVQMVDPSPMSIASLSLSPRRNGTSVGGNRNIFAAAVEQRLAPIMGPNTADDDEEGPAPLPSPTQQRSMRNPFAARRPALLAQKTAPLMTLHNQLKPPAFGVAHQGAQSLAATLDSKPDLFTDAGPGPSGVNEESTSPTRRSSKATDADVLPSTVPESSVHKDKGAPSLTYGGGKAQAGGGDMFKAVTKNNMMKGRTLVELAQARAGGKVIEPVDVVVQEGRKGLWGKKKAAEAPVWDPERDEMPSPFLKRGARGIRRL